jgi:serine phosphatase RsbU (regulator of sigma subunit)
MSPLFFKDILSTWALKLPTWVSSYFLILPRRPVAIVLVILLYFVGRWLQNGLLSSEFVRKTQLEADQIAARDIQQTLQRGKLEQLPGYELESFYKPLREVGGDYFDVIELPANRTLFALADVSGKGIAAALLAANIQALVRSIASVESNPLALAKQINMHLSRYSPSDRFATALFLVLSRDSGELSYVNAGHNAPILSCSGSTAFLEATGLPLGLFGDAEYETRTAVMSRGSNLLMFSDGLTDSGCESLLKERAVFRGQELLAPVPLPMAEVWAGDANSGGRTDRTSRATSVHKPRS